MNIFRLIGEWYTSTFVVAKLTFSFCINVLTRSFACLVHTPTADLSHLVSIFILVHKITTSRTTRGVYISYFHLTPLSVTGELSCVLPWRDCVGIALAKLPLLLLVGGLVIALRHLRGGAKVFCRLCRPGPANREFLFKRVGRRIP